MSRTHSSLPRITFVFVYLEIVSTAILTVSGQSGTTTTSSCYVCSGLDCAPHFDQLTKCNSSLSPDQIKCFFVATDHDHIYRGCYEPNGVHIQHCNKHRLNYCQICRGQGCNNHPIFSDALMSCRQCDLGRCHYTDEPDKITYRTCLPFFYGHVPRCFTFFYYGRLSYFFNCANAIPLAIRSACEVDTFNTVCRYCDYPNCNDRYFANFRTQPHYRFLCYDRNHKYTNCNVFVNAIPMMACIFEAPSDGAWELGCLGQFSYEEYEDLVQKEDYRLCFDDQKCNKRNRDFFNVCAKDYEGTDYGVSKCSLKYSRCMFSKWVDEYQRVHTNRHCESRQFCSHYNECYYCDKSTSMANPCNAIEDIHTGVYQCYYCDSPFRDCSVMNKFTPNRTHFCTDEDRRCFTHINKDRHVVRGCYFDGGPSGSPQKACEQDPDNCDICKGGYCNNRPTRMYCYVCSGQNSLCQYDQVLQGMSVCPGNDVIRTELGCYTVVHADGLVERGCWQDSFECPYPDAECHSCSSVGCNNATYREKECLDCAGTANGDCGEDITYLTSEEILKPCPVHIETPLCYVAYKNNNSLIERGCSAKNQYREWMEPVCSRGLMNCTFCNESKCNYFTLDPFAD